jgi:DNA-binding transcriptional regulator YiaG
MSPVRVATTRAEARAIAAAKRLRITKRRAALVALAEDVGGRIKLLRQAHGATMQEWVDKYELTSPGQLHNWESGRSLADIQFAIRLCEDYRVSLDFLFRNVHPRTTQASGRGVAAAYSQT